MHALEVAVDIKERFLFLQISFSVFDITSPLLSHLLLVLFKVYMTHTEGHPLKKGKMVRLEKLDPLSWFIPFILLMSPQTKMDGLLLD